MNVPTRLAAFTLGLGVVFAAAYGVGALAGPVVSDRAGHDMDGGEPADAGHEASGGQTGGGHDADGGYGSEPAAAYGPGGLAVSADGYTLRQLGGAPVAGRPVEYAFQILDAAAAPVTRYTVSHDKPLHLIVVRRDLTGFQHLHPQLSPDGTWRTPLTLPGAGDWRVFADFQPESRDRQVILGIDVPVGGEYRPQPLPVPADTATVDGYTVAMDGHLTAGRTSRLTLTVSRGDKPVTDLQPYLGAYGHLVALRAGDLAYLHVHPQPTTGAGPAIAFDVEVPTAGAYRLFLDFQHDGVVRIAAFTATAD
jgi:hypothetical protein